MLKDQQTVCLFNGAHIVYPPGDRVAQYLYEGWFEANDMAFVTQFLTDGDTFFDLGAHAGLYSVLAMGRIGENGRIVACDPNPAILPWLEKNLAVAAKTNPVAVAPGEKMIISQGVADQCGVVDFFLGVQGSTAYASLENNDFTGERTQIELTTFDKLVVATGVDKVDFVKVDIEGAEVRFLEGARQTIDAHPEIVIMMEFSESNQRQFGETTHTLLEKINAMGLKLFDINIAEQTITDFDKSEPLWHKNLVLAKDIAHIETRLKQANDAIRIQSIDKAKQGLASMRLYQDSQVLHKLLNRLEDPIAKMRQIERRLSAGKKNLAQIDALAVAEADSIATNSTRADVAAGTIDDITGRLKGVADSITERLASISTIEYETAAAAKRLAEALRPIGAICDKLTGGDAHSKRVVGFLDSNADGAAINIMQNTEDVLHDQLGQLAGISDAVRTRLDAELKARKEEAELFSEKEAALLKIREEEAELFSETVAALNNEIERQTLQLDVAADTRRQLLAARNEIQQMGELALTLQRSRVSKLSRVLHLPLATVISQLIDIYCCVGDKRGEKT